MPSPLSLFAPFLTAVAKLSPNASNAYSAPVIQEMTNPPPYLSHPAPMILPNSPEVVTPSYEVDTRVNNSSSSSALLAENTSAKSKIFANTLNTAHTLNRSTPALRAKPKNAKAKAKALQQIMNVGISAVVPSTIANQNTVTQSSAGSTSNFESKSTQLRTLIGQYTAARETLFQTYAQFENNGAIAQYNVREISLSLLAAIQYAQSCGIYFEKVITDDTLTQAQINVLQKDFDAFQAQCKKDCIFYKVPREREFFYPAELNPPANINDIVKILHLLQYVINGYAKIMNSETGIYPTNIVIDYTKSGGTMIETGVLRVDINMFQNLRKFFHMIAHEIGHLATMIFKQESTRTVPAPKLSYNIPSILAQQFPNQQNEAEADLNAAILGALYDIPFSYPFSDFAAQTPLPPAQVGQDSHPQGIERAAIMQSAVSTLSYHFNNNHFGTNNIWHKFAQKVRSISGINFSTDIPSMAELFRIYNLSPNDSAQQIRTLQAGYPNLFTQTTRGDYPPAPLVAVGLDKQLASTTNPNIPFQQIRRGTPTQSIESFQQQWATANGQLPFPAWITPPPSAQPLAPRFVSNVATFPLSNPANAALIPPPASIAPRSVPAAQYDGSPISTATHTVPVHNVPLAIPETTRPDVVKEQLFSFALHSNKHAKHPQSSTDASSNTVSEKTTRRLGAF